MQILIILNDPPCGTERSYNGLRLAKVLIAEQVQVTVFLLADAVARPCFGYTIAVYTNSVIEGARRFMKRFSATAVDA